MVQLKDYLTDTKSTHSMQPLRRRTVFETHQLVCLSHLFFVVASSWPFKRYFFKFKKLWFISYQCCFTIYLFTKKFISRNMILSVHSKFSHLTRYRKVASSNTSCLEAHAGFFRLIMKGIFNPYVLWPFDKKLIS